MSILAFVDNTNTVTLILNTDPTLVSSFTTSAHIVEITELAPDTKVGWTYDGTNFIAPPPTYAEPVDVLNEEPSTPITP